jgi:hypothetical protein
MTRLRIHWLTLVSFGLYAALLISPAELDTFLSKLRIHQIATQDGTIGWLRDTFPRLFIIHSQKTYQGMFGGSDPISNLAWVNENIRNNHRPLCAVYPHEGMGCTGVCEGDSPSFLWLVSANRGLNDPDDSTQESWGGQFKKNGDMNHYIDGPGRSSISKWRHAYQAEFKQRADWCVKSYAEANHPLVVKLAHPLDMKVRPGDKVSLGAEGTTDPDGDELAFHWWQHREAGSYDGTIEIRDAGKQDASFLVPGDAGKGGTIHIICEVTDNGTLPLTRYQRVIMEVRL